MDPAYLQPPLSDYALIGDCRSAALVSRQGSIDWLCLPDMQSPSVFAALLDPEKGGRFTITVDGLISAERCYRQDTAILETILTSRDGKLRLTDCMPVLPDARHHPELEPLREILRHAEVVEGNPVILVWLEARPNYGRQRGLFKNRGKLGWALQFGDYLLSLLTDFPLAAEGGILAGGKSAQMGSEFWFSLTFDADSPGVLLPLGEGESQARIALTEKWWCGWIADCQYEGPHADMVRRSAITLRMLTFSISGALTAAATTSLPEKPGGGMNWDYRFCWPRDAALTLSAFIDCGLKEEASAFFGWLLTAASVTRPYLKVMYDLYGRFRIREKELDHLSGYRGARPVRIGNAAIGQAQLDVYGEVMFAVEDWVRHYGAPTPEGRRMLAGFGRVVCKIWREPDNGIWEIRDQKRHYTYSKVMAWYVLDSLIRLHDKKHLDIPRETFAAEREALRSEIEARAFHKGKGCYVAFFDGDIMDASLLMLPRCGYIRHDDPRMVATWEAVRRELGWDGMIRRYPSGFAGSEPGEAVFIICNFWAVDYLWAAGRRDEADELLKKLIAAANDVGIYAEGLDPGSGEFCGNMPQAFSHAALINSLLIMNGTKKKEAGS